VIRTALLLLAVASAPLAAQNGAAATRSVAVGVYTEDQATRGKSAFDVNCASCHLPSDHTGDQFRMDWFGRNVYDLFKVLKTTMPEDNIGGLSDDDYTRVIAYILKLNGFPAGKDSLPSDSTALRQLRIAPADSGTPAARRRR
jgi:mono/diheme cytochrome c family protein